MTTLFNKLTGGNFTTNIKWFMDWAGNGHTRETDPVNNGWKVKAVAGRTDDLVILGRIVDGKQVKGCASILPMGDILDVAIYDDLTPKEILAVWAAGQGYDCPYYQIGPTCGWGLRVINQIEAEMDLMADMAIAEE